MYDPMAEWRRREAAIRTCRLCIDEYRKNLAWYKKVFRYLAHRDNMYPYLGCEGCATYLDL